MQMKKIAFYIRISNEDAAKERNEKGLRESNSIVNQRHLLWDFVLHNSEFYNRDVLEFCDDGYSGTNFERPAFQKMIKSAREGEVDCILVKDFSRFGRNYIEVGTYIEQILPFLQVRFLAVNENYDSKHSGKNSGADVALKNLVNDLYSKEYSDKVKAVLNAKKAQGMFVSGIPPYGYKIVAADKHRFVVDDEVAEVIREIYNLAYQGIPKAEIVRQLNQNNIETPFIYLKRKHQLSNWKKKYDKNLWTYDMVYNILKNEVYIGNMAGCKYEVLDIGSRKKHKKNKEDWIVVEDTHEAIVSRDIFQVINDRINQRRRTSNKAPVKRPLTGKVFCRHCGHPMRWCKREMKPSYYRCSYLRIDTSYGCKGDHVEEERIENSVLNTIQVLSVLAQEIDKTTVREADKKSKTWEKQMKQLNMYEAARKKHLYFQMDAYEQYSLGKLPQEDFQKLKEMYDFQMRELDNSIKEIKDKVEECNKMQCKDNAFVNSFKKYSHIDSLSHEVVDELIEAVYCFDSEHMEIVCKFQDAYEEAINFLKKYKSKI